MDIKVLIAEDDIIYRELISDILKKEGYIVLEACNGKEAIEILFSYINEIDLLILDVMMPEYDGWEVLSEIRKNSDIPIVMLTALGDERYETFGLNKGADDYIGKPFSYEIFIARINAILRKIKKERMVTIDLGELNVNPITHKIISCGKYVELNRKEYNLLMYFIKNKNIVLTREQILINVWGYDFEGDVRTIDTHIKTLRAKLNNCGDYIKTVRGSGYMFEIVNIKNN